MPQVMNSGHSPARVQHPVIVSNYIRPLLLFLVLPTLVALFPPRSSLVITPVLQSWRLRLRESIWFPEGPLAVGAEPGYIPGAISCLALPLRVRHQGGGLLRTSSCFWAHKALIESLI